MCSTASNGAARQSPDEHRNEASRRGGWIKIKSGRRANARPVEWRGAGVHRSMVGGLFVKAAWQPTNFFRLYPNDRSHAPAWERRQGRSAFRFWMFNRCAWTQTFPTYLSGCSSEAGSLVFGCRWQFSDRVWEPGRGFNPSPVPP